MCIDIAYDECVSVLFFFFSSRRRHTRCSRDWSSDVCSSDLIDSCGAGRGPGLCGGSEPDPSGHHVGQADRRSEEHTSELQSRLHLVCRLLLEKKKTSDCVSSKLVFREFMVSD